LKVCFALDQSYSICGGSSGSTTNCTIPLPFCCPNYVSAKNFTVATINGIQMQTLTTTTYGIVPFATNATTATSPPLSNASNAISTVNAFNYSGGSTSTNLAFTECTKVLGTMGKRILVILTDGLPDNSTTARDAATQARNASITVVSVGVGSSVDYANLLDWTGNNSNLVLQADNFTALNELIQDLVQTITCA
jgi:uncharacterized protein YegL